MGAQRTNTTVLHLVAATLIAGCFGSGALAESPHQPVAEGFVQNLGQIDDSVRYYARGGRTAVYFTDTGPVLEIRDVAQPIGGTVQQPRDYPTRSRERRNQPTPRRFAVGVRFIDAVGSGSIEGVDVRRGRHSYLLGDDPRAWRSGVRSFERVVYREVWPGIDLEYRLDGGRLVYEILPRLGADLSRVRFDYDGLEGVEQAGGALRLETPLGVIEDRRPAKGNWTGEIRFAARAVAEPGAGTLTEPDSPSSVAAGGDGEEGIYLLWSSFLGGERDDAIFGVALDGGENPVVAGVTRSVEFPTTLGVLDTEYNGSFDAFVSKFSADGTTLIWSTYLGGDSDDRGWAIRLDALGRPIVAGVTASESFPTTAGAYDTTPNGSYDAFVTKLAADGTALVWSTYYGGSEREWDLSGLDLDAAGRPTFVGSTRSENLPTSPGAHDIDLDGMDDAFVAQLEADGSALTIGSYLGGDANDVGEDVVVDSAGRPVVVGRSTSANFPTTTGAFQTSPSAGEEGFVTKLAADGGSLVFSTYLGGDGRDECFAVALDGSENVLVTGGTESTDFPTTPGSFQDSPAGPRSAFVSRLEADGTALAWGTYYGGEGFDDGFDIAADSADRPVFVGSTCSFTFPVAGPPWDGSYNNSCDAFVAKLATDGSAPVYSTFIGGERRDSAYGLALGPADRPVVGGETISEDFPTTPGAYDPTFNSPNWEDGFLFVMFNPGVCTFVSGLSVPELTLAKPVGGVCPDGTPEGNLVDLIEGQLDQLSATDIGVVETVACDAGEVTFRTDTVPPPGLGLFQLARYSPDGTYVEGGEVGLVGDRTPVAGDCP